MFYGIPQHYDSNPFGRVLMWYWPCWLTAQREIIRAPKTHTLSPVMRLVPYPKRLNAVTVLARCSGTPSDAWQTFTWRDQIAPTGVNGRTTRQWTRVSDSAADISDRHSAEIEVGLLCKPLISKQLSVCQIFGPVFHQVYLKSRITILRTRSCSNDLLQMAETPSW